MQCEGALTELHKEKLTHGSREHLSTQLVDLHAELDSLQRAMAHEHAAKPLPLPH